MRITLEINEALLQEVVSITGAKNESDAVRMALEEYVRDCKIQRLLALRGKLDPEENWQKLRGAELGE